jgi:hypothetical protein
VNRARLPRLAAGLAAVLSLSAAVLAPTASAETGDTKVVTIAPDFVSAGKLVKIVTDIRRTTPGPMGGELIVTYTFPAGVQPAEPSNDTGGVGFQCSLAGQVMQCTGDASDFPSDAQLRLDDKAFVEPGATGTLAGSVEVSGSAVSQPVTDPLSFTVGKPDAFAIKDLAVSAEPPSSYSASQAAADPAQLDTDLTLVSEAAHNFDLPNPNVVVTAPPESFRDVITHVPPGLIADPSATPLRCTAAQLTTPEAPTIIPHCPLASQIGILELGEVGDIAPLYNLVPPAGYPAAFGTEYNSIVVVLLPKIRPSDNGIDLVVEKTPSSIPLPRTEATIWGVPADPSHNRLRGTCLQGYFGFNSQYANSPGCQFSGERTAFLRNPTSCPGTPLPWSMEIDTYQHPGAFVSKATTSDPIEGCDKVPFNPSLSLAPSEHAAHSPSGLQVELSMPQNTGPDGLAESDLRSVDLQLPNGVSVNPASADGLEACSDSQLRLGLEGPSQCPEAAKIGSLELSTPLLEDPLSGSVYLRSQASQDPESGDMFRLALEIRSDERGVDIKLPGSLKVNARTGQLTTHFADLPQLPFESMQLHLKTGSRAPLTTPSTCGTYAAHALLEGWNGKIEEADPSFTVDQSCTAPTFDPGFEAGVANATAGEFAPFNLRVTRGSGQPNISRIDATLPEGELAKLAGVPVCGGVQVASGECPAGSRIGSVVSGIGEGANPLYLPQPGKSPTAVYLAGPYKGAPYSVLAKVPAQSGPFDLGQVLVRSALRIDPESVQVTVASDPLPQIFAGIPVSYRDVRVQVDKPHFTLNPTDCAPTTVKGAIGSAEGQTAHVSDRFQVGDCASLGFGPKLSIALKGKTRRAGHPALTAVLQMPKEGANIARTSVALPRSEFLAQGHIGTSCTRVQYNAGAGGGAGCPKGSVYGHARAFSPLLDRPLEGPVYLRSNGGDRTLPDLVASLDGQIHVDLVGYIDSDPHTGGLRTTFANVPDAPVSKFVLKMPGGKKSLLENSSNICRGKHRAVVRMGAQNGRAKVFRPLVRAKCGKGARAH